jgi:quinol monooxygenase YgiN
VIRHVVFFSVPDPADREAVEAGLKLLEQNPHALKLAIRPNIKRDLFANEVDFVVYGEFVDEAALDAYKAHPIYGEATAIVKPKRGIRVAADFRLD